MKKIITLLSILGLLFIATESKAQNGYTKTKTLGGIEEYRLNSNDLTVLLLEDHSAPVLTFMVTYNVGSRNEVTGTTGATHLLEHLMFKGTDKYNRNDNTGLDALLQNRGAILNATTWLDRTNYYENLPSEHLELAVDIEADRMRNLWLREEDRKPEMTVVRNEFERGENSPFGALNKEIWAAAFQAHPYHHSTIGWRSDIENVPIEKLRAFYDTYYWPNNATVTVIGDFDKANALKLIKKYYGEIPRSPNPIPQVYTAEPEQQGARRVTVQRAGQLGVVGVGFKAPEGSHEDFLALSVLDKILTDGKTSRFYKQMIDPGKVTSVFNFYFPFKDPSLFVSYAFLAPGAGHEEVETMIWEQIEDIKANGVTEEEVKRAITQITAETAYARDGSFSMASQINEAIAMGDWTFYIRYPEEVKTVTPEQVQAAVQKYFREDKSTTGYFIPKVPGASRTETTTSMNRAPDTKLYYRNPGEEIPQLPLTATPHSFTNTDIAKNINKKTVSGIEVYSMKTGVKDVVRITGSIAAGDWYSPESNAMIADLTGNMLDQGTTDKDKFQIAEELENLGATINFSVGSQTMNFNVQCLRKDLPKVISLLAEQLRYPAFDEAELEKLKIQREGAFQRNLESTNFMAGSTLSQIIYNPDHPNYQLTVEEMIGDLRKVTSEDLKAFHSRYYGPVSMKLVAVGDLDPKTLEGEIDKAFKGWTGGMAHRMPAKAQPTSAQTRKVQMEDKTSISVSMGIPLGIDNNHPDYLPLYIGTYVLGGNFSARLMSTVRDKEGLTYGIGSNLSGTSLSDGHWNLTATFAPALLEQGLNSTMRELKDWVENGISQEELDAKKSTISGAAKVQLATTGGMAGYIHNIALRGKDVSYADQYFADIEALTLEEVNNAIKKYIDLNRMVTVEAGTLPSEE